MTLQSRWSRLNKQRAGHLIQQGLMTATGLEKSAATHHDGAWSQLDAVEALKLPADLKNALAAHTSAQQKFLACGTSSKKNILWGITSARCPETRLKRLEETVPLAEQPIKANHDRQSRKPRSGFRVRLHLRGAKSRTAVAEYTRCVPVRAPPTSQAR
jgi:uncharacterized protein YdeI (YjbR/CyaY-like superfamily)